MQSTEMTGGYLGTLFSFVSVVVFGVIFDGCLSVLPGAPFLALS